MASYTVESEPLFHQYGDLSHLYTFGEKNAYYRVGQSIIDRHSQGHRNVAGDCSIRLESGTC